MISTIYSWHHQLNAELISANFQFSLVLSVSMLWGSCRHYLTAWITEKINFTTSWQNTPTINHVGGGGRILISFSYQAEIVSWFHFFTYCMFQRAWSVNTVRCLALYWPTRISCWYHKEYKNHVFSESNIYFIENIISNILVLQMKVAIFLHSTVFSLPDSAISHTKALSTVVSISVYMWSVVFFYFLFVR